MIGPGEGGSSPEGPPGMCGSKWLRCGMWFGAWLLMMDLLLSTDIYMCMLIQGSTALYAHMILATLCV